MKSKLNLTLCTSWVACLTWMGFLSLCFLDANLVAQDRGENRRSDEGQRWEGRGGQPGGEGRWEGRGGQPGGEGRWEGRGGQPGGEGRWGGRGGAPGGGAENRGGDRRWNPEDFIKRLDVNGDGKLDPSEMAGRTERYISGLGFDTTKPVLITTIIDKVKADRGEQPASSTSSDSAAKKPRVPGFGASSEKVSGFSGKADLQALDSMFSESIIAQVDWVMQTYDKNNDGFLDQSEMAEIPAGSPPLADSDTDRDGKLSRLEMAYRYRAREQFSRRNGGETSREGRSSNRSESSRTNHGKFSADPSNLSSSSSSRRSSAQSSGNRSFTDRTQRDRVASEGDNDRIVKYVENIFEKYDEDKDGKLSKTEAADIRNPPKADADGFITKEAYINFLNPTAQPAGDSDSSTASTSSSSGTSATANNQSQSRSSWRDRRDAAGGAQSSSAQSGSAASSSSSNRPRTKTTFEDYDENGNGMIEMHEFSDDWNDKLLEEFYAKDKNRDGVITRQEWKN